MLQPWHVEVGQRYAESLDVARKAAGDCFDENLAELKRRVRIHPGEATPFLDGDHRVLQLFDIPNGYSLAIYVTLDHHRHRCRLEWIEVGPLDPDFDPWN
jgi:hypothetical protein